MPTYEIEQYELHVMKYRIEADSEADAIARLLVGEGEPVDNSLEFADIADEYGMSLSENPELSSQLFDKGVVKGGDTIIGSIRSIRQVE
jgi:hypothetical protein